ncbi:MAG: hypothetical protein ABIJ81_02415 [Patescibacteria group bacterium]
MRKRIFLWITITIVIVIIIISGIFYLLNRQPYSSTKEMTSQECISLGGKVFNSLDIPKEYHNKDVIAKVTGMLCPCVCVYEAIN